MGCYDGRRRATDQEILRLMFRHAALVTLCLATALAGAACGDDSPTGPTDPGPVQIIETFPASAPGRLTPNGGVTHTFPVQQTGDIIVAVTTLPEGVSIGVSLGSWNGVSCSQGISRDDVVLNGGVVGQATGTGNYCVRVYDANGSLTGPVEYQLTVTHY